MPGIARFRGHRVTERSDGLQKVEKASSFCHIPAPEIIGGEKKCLVWSADCPAYSVANGAGVRRHCLALTLVIVVAGLLFYSVKRLKSAILKFRHGIQLFCGWFL